MPAYLDTGSRLSIGGNDIISLVSSHDCKVSKTSKVFKFLKGTFECNLVCKLQVKYDNGSEGIFSSRFYFFYSAG
jgi:hypothetical protein